MKQDKKLENTQSFADQQAAFEATAADRLAKLNAEFLAAREKEKREKFAQEKRDAKLRAQARHALLAPKAVKQQDAAHIQRIEARYKELGFLIEAGKIHLGALEKERDQIKEELEADREFRRVKRTEAPKLRAERRAVQPPPSDPRTGGHAATHEYAPAPLQPAWTGFDLDDLI